MSADEAGKRNIWYCLWNVLIDSPELMRRTGLICTHSVTMHIWVRTHAHVFLRVYSFTPMSSLNLKWTRFAYLFEYLKWISFTGLLACAWVWMFEMHSRLLLGQSITDFDQKSLSPKFFIIKCIPNQSSWRWWWLSHFDSGWWSAIMVSFICNSCLVGGTHNAQRDRSLDTQVISQALNISRNVCESIHARVRDVAGAGWRTEIFRFQFTRC